MTKEALQIALEALTDFDYDKRIKAIESIKEALETKDEPVCRLQEPTVERAWFTIAELNAWADKKLSENPHWVMPKDEPERDEPPPQRTWVGLKDDERKTICNLADADDWHDFQVMDATEAKLKEKNGY